MSCWQIVGAVFLGLAIWWVVAFVVVAAWTFRRWRWW